MDYMLNDPTMLEDLDFLYKNDRARKALFYYQVRTQIVELLLTNGLYQAGGD